MELCDITNKNASYEKYEDTIAWIYGISTTNLAACVCVQNLTNFCPHALISTPNVPKILFA